MAPNRHQKTERQTKIMKSRVRCSGSPKKLYLFVKTQFRTQNRFLLLLELLWNPVGAYAGLR